MLSTARQIISSADDLGCEIVLPSDVVIAHGLEEDVSHEVVQIAGVPTIRWIALDIGPASVSGLIAKLSECRTLLWNGPLSALVPVPFDKKVRMI